MELVSDRWYRGFTLAVTAICVVTLIASIVTAVWPAFRPYGLQWGMTAITLTLSAIQLLYMVLLHRYLLKRLGYFGSSLIVTFLFMIIVVALIHRTGQLHSWYQSSIVYDCIGLSPPGRYNLWCWISMLIKNHLELFAVLHGVIG